MSETRPFDHVVVPMPPAGPSSRGESLRRAQLPVPLSSFVGRDQEIRTVADLLIAPKVRLVTIIGPGGVGKTRLALRATVDVDDRWFDEVSFVPLASIHDPGLVLPTVARALDAQDMLDRTVTAWLQDFLADRNVLLVLDNMEHLLDAVPGLADLMACSPRLTILCTSRTRLNVSGEHVVSLAPLPANQAQQLFVERAQAHLSDFVLTDEVMPIIDKICARLDGLPLAIELAAARLPVLPPRALLVQLKHRLDLLTHGPRGAPKRLRELRAAIEWSYDLLTDAQQALFRRLGVFDGGFTLEAVQAVATENRDVLNDVSALAAASLVNPTYGVGDEPRFTMLETIREYAMMQLAISGEEEDTKSHHTSYFLAMSEEAKRKVVSPRHRVLGERLEIEHDNLRSVFQRAFERGDVDTAQRLVAAVGVYFWIVRGYLAEGRLWADRARALGVCTLPGVYAEVLFAASEVAGISGHFEQAVTLAEEALSRSRTAGDNHLIGLALFHLANAVGNRGAGDPGPLYEEALDLLDNSAGWTLSSPVLYNLATVLLERDGDIDRSKVLASEALVRWRDADIPWGVARALGLLADIARRQGELTHATALNRQALTLHWEMGDKMGIVTQMFWIASVASADRDQVTTGTRLAGAAEALAEELGMVLPQDVRDLIEHDFEMLRVTLGEKEFTNARTAGRALTIEEAVTLALTVNDSIGVPVTKVVSSGLTHRENEVLTLLAEGHSDQEIADALGISYRTVTSYVRNILDKLDVTSRTAAAALAIRRGLI